MSGKNIRGPVQKSRVRQKGKPTYDGGKISKESEISIDDEVGRSRKDIKIGIRVQGDQDITEFKLFGTDKYGNPKEIPTTPDAVGEIERELQSVSPAPGEKWVGYIAQYKPKEHGLDNFRTSITVDPFAADPKGFQEVAVAFTYAEKHFDTDHYLVATSILPGSDADPVADAGRARKKPGEKPKAKKATKKSGKSKRSR